MTSFLKSSHASWASGCRLPWYCCIPLSCLDRIGCTSLEQKRYQIEDKPSHGVGVLNETIETRIAMHHPDYLLSNAAEYTGRIDSALVSILRPRATIRCSWSFYFLGWECLFRITYWTALIPIQLAGRILEIFITDIMVFAATHLSHILPSPSYG